MTTNIAVNCSAYSAPEPLGIPALVNTLETAPSASSRLPYEGSFAHTHLKDGAPAVSSVFDNDVSSEGSALLETLVPMFAKLQPMDNMATTRDLGLCVRTGRGGPHGSLRLILVRLTDPTDPFLLFELELLEEDYKTFKERLELLVDFGGFPRFLVSMFQGVIDGLSPFQIGFSVHPNDANRGTLRIIEVTTFKTVEHISLILTRQGDTGQKRYLAERFQHYEQAYLRCSMGRKKEAEEASCAIQALKHRVEELSSSVRSLQEELRVLHVQSENDKVSSLSALREVHLEETQTLRNSYEEKLKDMQERIANFELRFLDETQKKDACISDTRERAEVMESTLAALRFQLKVSANTCKSQELELEKLRESHQQLLDFKLEASKVIAENELNYVTLSERLRSAVASLRDKSEELEAAKAQFQKQDSYITILSDQNNQVTERVKHVEKSLEKANHIIGNQIQTIKNTKERLKVATEQLRNQQAYFRDYESAATRTKDELSSCREHIQDLQRTNRELSEQLQKTDGTREKLSQELQQAQAALVHLQRNTSSGSRRWGGGEGLWLGSKGSLSAGLTSSHASSWKPSSSMELLGEIKGLTSSPSGPAAARFDATEDAAVRVSLFAGPGVRECESPAPATPFLRNTKTLSIHHHPDISDKTEPKKAGATTYAASSHQQSRGVVSNCVKKDAHNTTPTAVGEMVGGEGTCNSLPKSFPERRERGLSGLASSADPLSAYF